MPAGAEDLFDGAGYRLGQYRAPVPAEAPGAVTVGLAEVQVLRDQGALLLDVMGVQRFEIAPDGTWLTPERRDTIPRAHWLPVVGWGRLEPWQAGYLETSLLALTAGDRARAMVVFCKVDCWLSWNAAKRIAAAGYTGVHWFPGGADAWAEAGLPLERATPLPRRE